MRAERLKLNEALLKDLKPVLNEDQFKEIEQAIERSGPGARTNGDGCHPGQS